jgi:hypothetical protein
MDYSKANKEAWEEAFDKHQKGYEEDPALRINRGDLTMLEDDTLEVLGRIGLKEKAVAQFCCNNGRELLTLLKMGAASGTGFDIAENFITEGRRLARETQLEAEFLITIGALCWFADLDRFFSRVSLTLKEGGTLLINEQHPYTNMLAMPGEAGFDAGRPDQVVFPYFKKDPWINNDGVDYIGGTTYESKSLYSFSHSFGAIFNSLRHHGLILDSLQEFDYDISESWPHLKGKGLPLSYILVAQKQVASKAPGTGPRGDHGD